MKFSIYALFSLVFFIVVFAAAMLLCIQQYGIDTETSLIVALWVCAPVGVFFICTSVLLFYRKLRTMLIDKKLEKDFSLLIDQIHTQATNLHAQDLAPLESKDPNNAISAIKPSPNLYHPNNQQLSAILARFYLVPVLDSLDSGNYKLDKLLSLYRSIAQGTLEDIRKYRLANDNPFTTQNTKNYALKSSKNALEVFIDDSYSDDIRAFAFRLICASKNSKYLQKALHSDACQCLESTDIQQALILCKELEIDLDSVQIARICTQAHFNALAYLSLAKTMQALCTPDVWLQYFEQLAGNDDNAHEAYLFVLVELEMMSKLEQELKGFGIDEMKGLRAYVELKRLGKHYPISAFVIER